jgi:hypothetical protein
MYGHVGVKHGALLSGLYEYNAKNIFIWDGSFGRCLSPSSVLKPLNVPEIASPSVLVSAGHCSQVFFRARRRRHAISGMIKQSYPCNRPWRPLGM